MDPELKDVAGHFRFDGHWLEAICLRNGHINDTYAVRSAGPGGQTCRYILQRINQNVFKNPAALMENVEKVTRHLRHRLSAAGQDPARRSLTLVPTLSGQSFYCDPRGEYWRAYLFIDGARTYELPTSLEHVYNAGKAFGDFQRLLADFPAGELHATIPDFHHTPKRFAAFVQAVARDAANRASGVRDEIAFVEQRTADTAVLVDLLSQDRLPMRVTHNDTKIDNVMIDDLTGEGICLLDLDTVMPGLALYDFGDAVRSGAALAAEDEPDLARAGMSLATFEALTRGYLAAAREFLTPIELDYLPFAARLITLEQIIRFLGDYLNGDAYYKINRPNHNLDRARTQIAMLRDMETNFDRMVEIVNRYRG